MGIVIRYTGRLIFADDVHSTNNTTEYEALLLSLRKMKALGQQTFTSRQTPKLFRNISRKRARQESLN
jgi:ribonuclease HI